MAHELGTKGTKGTEINPVNPIRVPASKLASSVFALFVLFVAKPLTLVIAHRGASAEKPENTLAAFRRALALKADGIELDVQASADGMPVVFHDARLRRLTGFRGRLADLPWRELKQLRVAGTERIPRLSDVFALLRDRGMVVQVELKRGAAVAPVLRDIRRAKATRGVILASFEPELVAEARRLAPEIPRMLISAGRGGPGELLRQMAAAGADGLSLNYKSVRTRATVNRIHAAGATLWCWTVNDATAARRLAEWGVDALIGDNPALLRDAV
ncbi:MAG: ugpQ [Lacunisphaera sp.]|nr:ugpQ [Lacunisphaera sp.]